MYQSCDTKHDVEMCESSDIKNDKRLCNHKDDT